MVRVRFLILFFCAGWALIPGGANAKAPASVDPLVVWSAMDSVLPQGGAGDDWRQFLRLADLRQQAELQENADPDVIADILKRLHTNHEFLRQDPYLTARMALADWLRQLDAAQPQRAPILADAALKELETPTAAQLTAARQIMRQSFIELQQFLAAHQDVRAGWENYFAWDKWRTELEKSGPMDPEMLARVAARLESAAETFPDPACRRAGAAVREASRLNFRASTTLDDARAQLEQIAFYLQQLPEQLSDSDRVAMSATNAWLQRRDIGGRLTAALLQLHSQPNLRVAISQRVLALGIEAPIDSTEPFADVIGGTTYRGTAHSQGEIKLSLIPNARQIEMQLDCRLVINSTSTGSPGGVTVQSGSTTNVAGVKQVSFDGTGLQLHPAQASANTNTQIYDIQSGRRIGRRQVNSRVQEGQGATEQEVARMSEQRLEAELNREANRTLLPLMRRWEYDLRRPLVLKDGMPQQIRTWSTTDFAYLVLTQAGLKQLGAPGKAPTIREPADIMVQVHESFVGNMGDSLLAGNTFSESELQKLLESLFGGAPASLQAIDPNNPWRITFAAQKPLEASVKDGEMSLNVRAAAFFVGEKEYPAMNIAVRYRLTEGVGGLVANRLDRLEISPPDLGADEKLGARQQAFRTMLRKRFDPVFPENWEASVFHMATLAEQPSEIRIRKVFSDEGWLSLAGELVETPILKTAKQ